MSDTRRSEVPIARKRKTSGKKRKASSAPAPDAVVEKVPTAQLRSPRRFMILVAIVAVVAVVFIASDVNQPSGDRVWSEEHGHYHDAAGNELTSAPSSAAPSEGQVWSEEHGHWHDASGGDAEPSGPADLEVAPRDPTRANIPGAQAPAGKVWSEEHGHWHDVE